MLKKREELQMNTRTLRPVVLAALTLSFLLPATGFAHHRDRHDDGSHRYDSRNRRGGEGRYASSRGFVTVTNDNLTELQVLVDRQVVGTVAPQSTARFGPFEKGTHKVKVRYICDGLRFPVIKERVEITGRHPARIVAPMLDAGILVLENAWIEPMVVKLNGRVVKRIPAESKSVVKVEQARGTLQMVTTRGTVAASRGIRLDALEHGTMALIPPSQGAVTIYNPSRSHALDILCARGSVLATIPPSSARRLDQKAGRVTLTASYRGEGIQTATVIASPFDQNRWTIDLPDYASLSVRNPNPFPVDVYAGGQLLGQVQGRDRGFFTGVKAGWTQLEFLGSRRGRTVSTASVDVDPLSGALATIPRVSTRDGRGSTTECERSSSNRGYSTRSQRRDYYARRW